MGKRKLLCTITVMLWPLILTGCARFNTTFDVKKNGKVDVTMLYAIMDMSGSDTETPNEEMEELEQQGWECTIYNQDGYIGYECAKRDVSLKELSSTLKSAEGNMEVDSNPISIKRKGLFTYVLDWNVYDEEQAEKFETYKRYFDMYEGYMTFVIKLPYKPKESNATSVSEDGKTLSWDLMKLGEGNNIHVEFSILNVLLVIVLILLVISGVVVLVFILMKRGVIGGNSAYPVHHTSNITVNNEMINPSVPMDIEYNDESTNELGDENKSEMSGMRPKGSPVTSYQEDGSYSSNIEENQPRKITCPMCGAEISANAMFCFNCGGAVDTEQSVTNENTRSQAIELESKQVVGTASGEKIKNPRKTNFLSDSNTKLLAIIGISLIISIIVLIIVLIVLFGGKNDKKNAETVVNIESIDDLEENALEIADVQQSTGLSRRPIPGIETQTILIGGYCVQIPSDVFMNYHTHYGGDLYMGAPVMYDDGYGSLAMTYYKTSGYGSDVSTFYTIEIESSVLGEGKPYYDEQSFRDSKTGWNQLSFEESFSINGMGIEHYHGQNTGTWQGDTTDVYLTVNQNEALSVSITYSSEQKDYKDEYDLLLDSLVYLGDGTYKEGVLFVKDARFIASIDKGDIDDGSEVLVEILGKDIDGFLNELNEFTADFENYMMTNSYEENIEGKEEYKNYIKRCEEYVSKIEKIDEVGIPENYMVGQGYGGDEMWYGFDTSVGRFIRVVEPYCSISEDMDQRYGKWGYSW